MNNIISLFDGISCGQEALKQSGILFDDYYASEIEEQAIRVTKDRHPETKHIGNVKNVRIPKGFKVDLLLGGSPCQGFSYAGKGLNFTDPRSSLFFEYVRVLKECRRYNPGVLFLLENVRMKQEFQDVISSYLGVKPVFINSGLVSAQNRLRLYWTNIPGVTQPIESGILLGDILETDIDKKYFISDKSKQGFIDRLKRNKENGKGFGHVLRTANDKSPTIPARYYKDGKECIITDSNGGGWRKLTVTELERLQGLPDGYTKAVSDINAYKALGNGWNVQIINHIFKSLK